jgi:hypothetical protein
MKTILEFEDYDPRSEYIEDERRELDLDWIRGTKEYRQILDLGFEDITSDQQELNNTLKLQRKKQPDIEGYSKVFYTIHPTGTVRRYNPVDSDEIPQGQGNTIRTYPRPFRDSREYRKALRYLFNYLRRKELKKDYR